MTDEKKKMTAQGSSVGADDGQSISKNSKTTIPDPDEKNNSPERDLEELYRRMRRMSDPAYLHTVTLDELMDNVFEGKSAVIENLLYTGAYILAGAPKIGKSFLVAQIAHHVSTGQDLWEYKVHQGTVLYLALEDDESRLQRRMFRMFGVEGTSSLHFATNAKMIGGGLDEQLEKFVREHSDTKLIIVDTLQKVREAVSDSYSYSSDYEVIGKLKQFADRYGVCVLIVHHTRKQPAGDSFEMISGTTGLLGCADGALLMQKEKRTDSKATLEVVGRDQPDQRLYLSKDQESLVWGLDHAENELWKQPPDPVLEAVAKIVSSENPEWEGSPTELAQAIQTDMAVNRLTKHYRFVHEVQEGDYVVFPSKIDRKINIGVVESVYFYEATAALYPNRRKVKWLKHLPRTAFSQGALHEVGSALSFFQVKNYADEYFKALDKDFKGNIMEPDTDETVAQTADEIIEATRDFILKELSKNLKG